jgi:phage terminase large subunit
MKIKANKQFYQCLDSSDKRFVIHNGGTRSGKTYAILQYLIYKALNTDPKEALNFTIVRKFLPSLKDSGYSDFFEILNAWGYYDETNHNKTDLKYKLNGHTFKFLATGDQPDRLRSMKRDILYIIECQELSKEEYRQLNYRTTTQAFFCYNPSMTESWIYDLEDNRAEDVAVFVSTYKDNNFLSAIQKKEIEMLQRTDPEAYRVYGLGLRASTNKGRIYKGWEEINELPEGGVFYAVDFGFFPDPTAIIKVVSANESIYVKELAYSTKMMDEEIIMTLRNAHYMGEPVYCDHNQKQTIEQLKRSGFNAVQGRKGSGSIIEGINFLKRASVFYHKDSKNLHKEYMAYSWKLKRGFDPDDDNAYESFPEDKNNHLLDALRMGYYSHFFVGNKFFVI